MSPEGRSRKLRYISAAIWIPVAVGICLFSSHLFNLVVVVFISIGVSEFYAMARHRGFSPHSVIGAFCAVTVTLVAWFGDAVSILYSLAASVIIVFTVAMARNSRDAMANLAVTVFGILYPAWLCSHVIMLRRLPVNGMEGNINFGGAGYVIMLLVMLWLGDGGAFFVGTGWGRRKLVPLISPNKTVEGSIGGIVITLVGALLIKDAGQLLEALGVTLFPDFPYAFYVLIAMGVAVTGQVGDLCQSYLKRDAGLKDTGNLFPGHGGFLDRFDSLMFTGPLLYYCLRFLGI